MQGNRGTNTDLLERPVTAVARPPMYRVLLHNDDYTPVEFVLLVLSHVFEKSAAEAMDIMMKAHTKGVAIVGTYTHEVAETKVAQGMDMAKQADVPLLLTIEEDR